MGQGTPQCLGQPLTWGFISPLTPLSQSKDRRSPEDLFQVPPRVTNPFTTSFQPKLGLGHFISRDTLPCKSSPSSPNPQGIHTYLRFHLGITTRARVRHFTAAGRWRWRCRAGTPMPLPFRETLSQGSRKPPQKATLLEAP